MNFAEFMDLPELSEKEIKNSKVCEVIKDTNLGYFNEFSNCTNDKVADKSSENSKKYDKKEKRQDRSLKKEKKNYFLVCDKDESNQKNKVYNFYKAVTIKPFEDNLSTTLSNSLHNDGLDATGGDLNQNRPIPIDITNSLKISTSNRSVDIVYIKNIDKILKLLPKNANFRQEQNKDGKDVLKITVWLTVKDIYSNNFYEVMYGHLIEKNTKNGKLCSSK